VALTAYVRMEDRIRVLAAGFQLYVPKPVDPAELLNVVARAIRMRGSGRNYLLVAPFPPIGRKRGNNRTVNTLLPQATAI
jgi:DNA-binding response OmpR family regulator